MKTATTKIKYCVICQINATECHENIKQKDIDDWVTQIDYHNLKNSSLTPAPPTPVNKHTRHFIDIEISLEEYENNLKNNIWPNLNRSLKEAKIQPERMQEINKISNDFADESLKTFLKQNEPKFELGEKHEFELYYKNPKPQYPLMKILILFLLMSIIITPLFWNSLAWILKNLQPEFNESYIDWIIGFYKIDLNYFPYPKHPGENNLLTNMFLVDDYLDNNVNLGRYAAWIIMTIFNFIPSFIISYFVYYENYKNQVDVWGKKIAQEQKVLQDKALSKAYEATAFRNKKKQEKYWELIEEEIK